ncbi:MAG TPA: replication-associated recombination protein A [Erysipelotrichaceae bacterium]|nr:replication-associated recombination protein A [Erysipelotrichaceae bacterium]
MEKPLADCIRPQKLEEMVGQHHLLDEGTIFRKNFESKRVRNMVFYGPPGVGKTTVANIIAENSGLSLFKLNGTSASIDDIKNVIKETDSIFNTNGVLLYLDEIQYLNKKQQQSLLEFVESGEITLIASTTENPYFYIYPALLSRCLVFEFKALSIDDIKEGLLRAANRIAVKLSDEALHKLALSSNGDMRKALNNLDFLTVSVEKDKIIGIEEVNELIDKAHIAYDRSEDKHFDHLSAFMKSLRGSDPDAAIFYLAKLLKGGDIIAASRRLLCAVSEDVGLAYPQLIPLVKSCVDSALQLGLPEARLPLANAALLIALAPKSNSAYLAIDEAMKDIDLGRGINVPRSLQNTHFDGEDATIKGQNYLYPHDYKNHYVKQQYLPDDLKNIKYYVPQDNKNEQAFKEYWKKIKKND